MSCLDRMGARMVARSPPAILLEGQQTQQHNNTSQQHKNQHNKTKMSHPGSHGGLSNSSKGIFPPLPPDNKRRPVTPEGRWRILVKSRGVRDKRIDDKPLSHCSVDDDDNVPRLSNSQRLNAYTVLHVKLHQVLSST